MAAKNTNDKALLIAALENFHQVEDKEVVSIATNRAQQGAERCVKNFAKEMGTFLTAQNGDHVELHLKIKADGSFWMNGHIAMNRADIGEEIDKGFSQEFH